MTSSEKVVGGSKTTIDKHPWQVSLRYGSRHTCGGSIINANTVLTAAHCLSGNSLSLTKVLYGSSFSTTGIPSGQTVDAAQLSIHEGYSSFTLHNDIGIIKLAKDIPFSKVAQPIAINEDHSRDLVGLKVEASGWGSLVSGGSTPNDLYVVEMPVIARHESNYTTASNYNDDMMMIAGRPGEGKDTCQGDSGGPLVLREHGSASLVGVVSWGYGCGWSGVYTRVSKYHSWIKARV